ncbi:PepSY-associated TM helix domain-containing protein [Duganella phyllosphaerae]|uniref:PepSY-associated TM helix n=1 Tax=Duganella phyllosphaerae TaxID=762836 RepID=A0A1E7W678_9BURK|nr:PepSY-associated TM helix domain-containing protein [Duganella phyllosphaerae]OEZ91438.1 hypothetical protein DUPY_50500 [Duganella phyllosphaerae]
METKAPGLRQAMAGLHAWAGVLAGWLLYAIFVTGGISYFREELTQWLRPELPARPAVLDQVAATQHALATLARVAASADRWQIDLPGPRNNVIEASWERGDHRERALLSPADGAQLHPRATHGGEFFYYFHFQLHYLPGTLGRWIVGLCAMMALVALLSGVIVHRRIFSDFFTFRPGKGQRSWLDAHNVSSVLGLPFYVMIVYTGLVTLMLTYMPWGALAAFGQQQARPAMAQALQARFETRARRNLAAPPVPIAPLMAQASLRWGYDSIGRVIVMHPGDAAARVAIVRGDGGRISVAPAYLLFHGVTGALLGERARSGPALTTWGTAYGLHLGRYADSALRWLYFGSSLLGAAMVATGLVLWTVKRRSKPSAALTWLRFTEAGNAACVAGLLAAVPTFLLSNRLLLPDLGDRAQWEVHSFFLCWGAVTLFVGWRGGRESWRGLWRLAAMLWIALPMADYVQLGQPARPLFIGFDSAFAMMGLLCAYLGLRTR